MCRTVHALLQTVICGVQMLVRMFMTIMLMIENLIRMILQTLYNFISFLLQMISLIPICVVFLLTSRLKCFMCGGGGPCPVARGGTCDCLMTALALVILFFVFRATGILDKIFYSLGYTKARPGATRFVPAPVDITRNDSDAEPLDIRLPSNDYDDDQPTSSEAYDLGGGGDGGAVVRGGDGGPGGDSGGGDYDGDYLSVKEKDYDVKKRKRKKSVTKMDNHSVLTRMIV